MATKNTRTGIVVLILFALGLAAWNWYNPSSGTASNAGFLGGGKARSTGEVSRPAGSGADGFKGTDEELQAVSGDR